MARMRPHVESSANFNRYQSAYRRHHSTETTLLRVLDDAYHAADNHSWSLLLQLDLSAAFDTLDKPTLLRQLNHPFGVRGTSHKWVDSYLNERSQYVRVGDRVSPAVHYLHLANRQRHRTLQKTSPCSVRRRHSTIHRSQRRQKESQCDNRQHAVLRRSRQRRMQGSSFSHPGSTSHPPVCVSR